MNKFLEAIAQGVCGAISLVLYAGSFGILAAIALRSFQLMLGVLK